MQALFVAIVILVGLVILVPLIFMVAALFRIVVGAFRAGEGSPNAAPPHDQEGVVASLAWPLRSSEVANANQNESIEGMGGPTPPGGPKVGV